MEATFRFTLLSLHRGFSSYQERPPAAKGRTTWKSGFNCRQRQKSFYSPHCLLRYTQTCTRPAPRTLSLGSNLQLHKWNPTILSGCSLFIEVNPALLCVFLYHYQLFTILTYAPRFKLPCYCTFSSVFLFLLPKMLLFQRNYFTSNRLYSATCTSANTLLTT